MKGTVNMKNILIVEDDVMLNNGICFNINADGSGFDFCIKVRETSSVPILFLTACDMKLDIITGFKLGGTIMLQNLLI